MKPIGRFTPTHDTSRTKSPTNSTPPSNPAIKSEFLSKSQQQALLSGNAKEIKRANDAALAEAIQHSLNEQPTHTKTSSSKRKITPSEWSAHAKNNLQLRKWFDANNYLIKPNSGKENNCLLISLLQHVTGNYDSQHTKRAQHYKSILQNVSKGTINSFDPLYSDSDWTTFMINKINQDYATDFSVDFYSADTDGKPAVLRVGQGKNSVIIFDQGGHFEAVITKNKP
jgi:hypothetical protein